ncbi:MAG: 2-dehydropantoate 2-reductase [Candidatus Dormibacteraeota bacterium]|nr:2-dehydropantoate 2-reductase [Candidatus Dormibacteraeota bacterium]
MRHAVLGVGGVGGLVGSALARSGRQVLLILSEGSLRKYTGRLRVESRVLGDFEVEMPAGSRLDRTVDVLWVTVKATQLEGVLSLAPPEAVGEAAVAPLLNGVDHVDRLREVYGERVLAASIAVESEKVGDLVVQPGPFAAVTLAPGPAAGRIAEDLTEAGFGAAVAGSEAEVLWTKLAVLAPLALGTSSIQAPMGRVRSDHELWELVRGCATEVCAVAGAEGVELEAERFMQALSALPDDMRSSMQKDLAAGRPLELEAVAGAVLRHGAAKGIPTPATAELRRRVAGQAASVVPVKPI